MGNNSKKIFQKILAIAIIFSLSISPIHPMFVAMAATEAVVTSVSVAVAIIAEILIFGGDVKESAKVSEALNAFIADQVHKEQDCSEVNALINPDIPYDPSHIVSAQAGKHVIDMCDKVYGSLSRKHRECRDDLLAKIVAVSKSQEAFQRSSHRQDTATGSISSDTLKRAFILRGSETFQSFARSTEDNSFSWSPSKARSAIGELSSNVSPSYNPYNTIADHQLRNLEFERHSNDQRFVKAANMAVTIAILSFKLLPIVLKSCSKALNRVWREGSAQKELDHALNNDHLLKEGYKQAVNYAIILLLQAHTSSEETRQAALLKINQIQLPGSIGVHYNELVKAINAFHFTEQGALKPRNLTTKDEHKACLLIDTFFRNIANDSAEYKSYLKRAVKFNVPGMRNILNGNNFKISGKNDISRFASEFYAGATGERIKKVDQAVTLNNFQNSECLERSATAFGSASSQPVFELAEETEGASSGIKKQSVTKDKNALVYDCDSVVQSIVKKNPARALSDSERKAKLAVKKIYKPIEDKRIAEFVARQRAEHPIKPRTIAKEEKLTESQKELIREFLQQKNLLPQAKGQGAAAACQEEPQPTAAEEQKKDAVRDTVDGNDKAQQAAPAQDDKQSQAASDYEKIKSESKEKRRQAAALDKINKSKKGPKDPKDEDDEKAIKLFWKSKYGKALKSQKRYGKLYKIALKTPVAIKLAMMAQKALDCHLKHLDNV